MKNKRKVIKSTKNQAANEHTREVKKERNE